VDGPVGPDGISALMIACEHGHTECVEALLALDANVEVRRGRRIAKRAELTFF